MTTFEIIRILQEKPDTNFIGCCGSVLQINGINAAINYLSNCGIQLRGIVIIEGSNTLKKEDYQNKYFVKQPGIEYIDGSILFADLKKTDRIRYYLESFRLLRNNSNTSDLYFVKDAFSFHWVKLINDSLGKRTIIYCEIDDGTWNYRHRLCDRFVVKVRNSSLVKCGFQFVRYLLKYILTSWIEPVLKYSDSYIDCKLMTETKYELSVNDNTIEYWRDSFKNNILSIEYEKLEILENNIFVLGTNDDGSVFDDIRLIIKRIVNISNDKGVKVIVKPHPRETSIDRYLSLGCLVMAEKHISTEEILSSLKKPPLCMLGYGSTALITGKVIYGIPTISFTSAVRGNDWYARYNCKNFEKRFGDTVICPRNIEEVISAFERILV